MTKGETMFKPQRARDTTEKELIALLAKYKELIIMTKYDGIRCLVEHGIVKGKTLLPIPNKYIQSLYGKEEYEGKEFELIVTDVNGNLSDSYILDTMGFDTPTIPTSTTDTVDQISGRSTSPNNILTGLHQDLFVQHLNLIKTRFKNTYNKTESDTTFLSKADNLATLANKDTSLLFKL